MIVASDLDEIISKVSKTYEFDERRIVGIMLARYNLPEVKNLIDSCYLYWHYNTGASFNIFWCGYGEYGIPEGDHIIRVTGDRLAYFDLKKFISSKRKLNRLVNGEYRDHLQLILVNYYEGKLHFDESARIDLEQDIAETDGGIRGFMEWLTTECGAEFDVASLIRNLHRERRWTALTQITLSDIVSGAIRIADVVL